MDDTKRQIYQQHLYGNNDFNEFDRQFIDICEEIASYEESMNASKKKKKIPQQQKLNKKISIKLQQEGERKKFEIIEKRLLDDHYFSRVEEMSSQEKILKKFHKDFKKNKSLFQHIWQNSEHNLEISFNKIQEIFLHPRGILLNEIEKRIFFQDGNQLVIGRSGTGKTTAGLLKLTAMEMTYKNYIETNQNEITFDNLRICFTTLSGHLKNDVESSFRIITNQNQNILNYDTHLLSQVNNWPLFTSIRKLINMIDGNLAIPFIQRDKNGRMQSNLAYQANEQLRTKLKKGNDFYQEIGIDQYVNEFWKQNYHQFEQMNIDSYTSYSQIHSYITGHAMSFLYPDGMVPEEQYIKTIGKTKTHLDDNQKRNIYKICQKYQSWKAAKKYFDLNDQVAYILQRIFEGEYDSSTGFFHYLFIDEVQDLNCSTLYLLALITEQSVFLGGDTAQTIREEISFRFTQIKAFFEKKFMMEELFSNNMLQQPLQQEQLTQNYRTHSQITDLNNALIKLLEIFFPTSIDMLSQESSHKRGPKPILLHNRELLYKFLQQDDKVSQIDTENNEIKQEQYCRFQAFLVRTQREKEQLEKLLENEGSLSEFQVYTIFDSKGLEFQDVITYNLLSSSFNSTSSWNVLGFLSKKIEKSEEIEKYIQRVIGKEFHKLIPELKKLYVAFSRARSRIFIYEDLKNNGQQFKNPITQFLEEQQLLEDKVSSETQLKTIMECHKSYIIYNEPKINKDQLLQQAKILFEKEQYKYAADFFLRVGDSKNYQICIGKQVANQAQKMIEMDKLEFERQKSIFLKSRKVSQNQIQSYLKIKEIFKQAIECFRKADDFLSISQIFFTLGEYQFSIDANMMRRLQIQQSNDLESNEKANLTKDINRDLNIQFLYNILTYEEYNNSNSDNVSDIKLSAYKEFDQFLEIHPNGQTNLILFVKYQLQEFDQLYNKLIEFHQTYTQEELIQTIHHYYPSILLNQQQKYDVVGQYQKENNYHQLKCLLSKQYQKYILPFQQIFRQQIQKRFNNSYYEQIFRECQQVAEQIGFKENLFLFHSILGYYQAYNIQIEINNIFKNQTLMMNCYCNMIYQNISNELRIEDFLDKFQQIEWVMDRDQNKLLSLYQQFSAFLGIHDKLTKRKICSENEYFNFTIDFSNNESRIFTKSNKNNIYYQLIQFQRFTNSKHSQIQSLEYLELYQDIFQFMNLSNQLNKISLDCEKLIQKNYPPIPQIQNSNPKQIRRSREREKQRKRQIENERYQCFFKKREDLCCFLNMFYDSVKKLTKLIQKQRNSDNQEEILKLIEFQKLLFIFYYGLKTISSANCYEDFENEIIESIILIISFIISFNISTEQQSLNGVENKIFIDALCSIFSYQNPLGPDEFFSDCETNIWGQYGFNNCYLVNSKSQFFKQDQLIIELSVFTPIIMNKNLIAVDRYRTILLCKKKIGDISKEFIVGYTKFLVYQTKQYSINRNQKAVQTKLNQSVQILFLENQLKNLFNQNFSNKQKKQFLKLQEVNQSDENLQNEQNQLDFILIDDSYYYKLKQNITQQGICLQFSQENLQNLLNTNSIQFDRFLIQEFQRIMEPIKNDNKASDEQISKNREGYVQQQEEQKLGEIENNQIQENEVIIVQDLFKNDQGEEDSDDDDDDINDELDEDEDIVKDEQNDDKQLEKHSDEFFYIFSLIQMRNITPFVKRLFDDETFNNEFIQLTLNFFQSKQDNEQIQTSLISLDLIQYVSNYKSQYYLLITGLAEFLKYIIPKDQKEILIIEEFKQYFQIDEDTITIEKSININKQYFKTNDCIDYLDRIILIVNNLNLPWKKKFIIKNMIVYVTLIFLTKRSTKLLYKNNFLDNFAQFLKNFVNYEIIKKSRRIKDYNKINEVYTYYEQNIRLKVFRNRIYNSLIYLMENRKRYLTTTLIQNLQSNHINLLIIFQSTVFNLNVNVSEKQLNHIINHKIKEQSQRLDVILSGIEQQRKFRVDQLSLQNQKTLKVMQKIDYLGYINNLMKKESQITKFLRLLNQEDRLKLQFIDNISYIQKTKNIIMNELGQDRINSSEKLIYSLQQLLKISKEEQMFQRTIKESINSTKNQESQKRDILRIFESNSQVTKKINMELQQFLSEPKAEEEKVADLNSINFLKQQLQINQ